MSTVTRIHSIGEKIWSLIRKEPKWTSLCLLLESRYDEAVYTKLREEVAEAISKYGFGEPWNGTLEPPFFPNPDDSYHGEGCRCTDCEP